MLFLAYKVIKDQKVNTSDGINLATDIYLPPNYIIDKSSPLPVILERTPYGKQVPSRSEIHHGVLWSRESVAKYFVQRGFIVVYQDCRGCYNSEGKFTKYLSEGQDGYDTIEWISNQSWCNGRIGTMGLSYAAHTQMAAACLNPPSLACMIIDSGGFSNSYQNGIRQGGAFELKQATWAFRQAKLNAQSSGDIIALEALESQNLHNWFKLMPWRQGHSPLSSVPEYESYMFEQWRNEDFDDYWKQLGIYAQGYYDSMRKVPTILMSSWYDAYVPTTMDNFKALSTKAPKKQQADNDVPVHLIMGPWLHGDRNIPYSGDVSFGSSAVIEGQLADDWLELRAKWFEKYLVSNNQTDRTTTNLVDPTARIFLMGGGSGLKDRQHQDKLHHGGRWIKAMKFPLPATEFVPFFLHKEGTTLSRQVPIVNGSITYDFDPKKPVPTIGGSVTSGGPIFEGGAFNQIDDIRFFGSRNPGIPLAARADVLVFETDILRNPLIVIGPIQVKLFISTNCPDTDFTAKLIDIYPPNSDYPNGYAMNIVDGIFRCRFHKSWSKPSMLDGPGSIYEIVIDLSYTANVFERGHKIRLDISSSNFPHYDVNPNSGESPVMSSRYSVVARNTVHFGKSCASHITLPLVPKDSVVPI